MIKTFSLSVLIIVITMLFSKTNIYSVEPEEFLQNPKQELKARNISKNVRCLVWLELFWHFGLYQIFRAFNSSFGFCKNSSGSTE